MSTMLVYEDLLAIGRMTWPVRTVVWMQVVSPGFPCLVVQYLQNEVLSEPDRHLYRSPRSLGGNEGRSMQGEVFWTDNARNEE